MTVNARFSVFDLIEKHELHVSSTESVVVGEVSDAKILLEFVFYLPISGRAMAGEMTILNNGASAFCHNEYSVVVSDFDDVEFSAVVSGSDIVLRIVIPALSENPVLKFRRKTLSV